LLNHFTKLLMKSVLDVTVSSFQNYNGTEPYDIKLVVFLTSKKYADTIELIRSTEDKKERDKLKATLPAITPSRTFKKRNQDDIIKHSGLVQFDIDYTGNEHIDNFENLIHEVAKLPYVAYCGFSASGRGFWGLVPIAYPDKHKLHLLALKNIFQSFGIKMDTAPSNIASLRGYSFDDKAYFNHAAETFTYIVEQPVYAIKKSSDYTLTDEQRFIRAIRKTQEKEVFAPGSKHCFLVKLAGYCNAVGIDEATCLNLVETNLRFDDDDDLVYPITNTYKVYKRQHAEYSN
jgi:hypothetical protein